ncbi:MAG: hypothetical protein ACLP05_04825 [Candidatus Kryptoniota bacterium]
MKTRAYKIGEANILIRASSEGANKRFFFGLNYVSAEEVANLDNPFFAFICGSLDRTLIIPAPVLIGQLPLMSHDRDGEYKIVIDGQLNVILSGKKNRLNCSQFINAWDSLKKARAMPGGSNSAEESFHSVLQGRLLEIGNIRGYQTFCPNKSKRFNDKKLIEIATLPVCPQLQFSNYEILRQIDVLWFREKNSNLIPEYAFEVELSTGVWSGVGRMGTLIDYANARLYVISDDDKKYNQVVQIYSEQATRYHHVLAESVGELYAAELNLRELREKIDL